MPFPTASELKYSVFLHFFLVLIPLFRNLQRWKVPTCRDLLTLKHCLYYCMARSFVIRVLNFT